jgi:hypothetical protein
VEITRPGDVPSLWKTEAKPTRLPLPGASRYGGKASNAAKRSHGGISLLRTDGTRNVIPLLGEFQVAGNRFRARVIGDSCGGSIVLWGAALAIAASSTAVVFLLVGFSLGPFMPTLALAGIALIAEKQSVRLSPSVEISVSFLPFILAAALLGPVSAMAVGAASLLTLFE